MKGTCTAISNEAQFKSAVDQLEVLLRRQLDLARKGNIAEVNTLAKKAHELVEQISESKSLAGPQFEEHRKRLKQLYGDVCLSLSAQMNDVSQALGRVYKGKKTVTLYRDNI
jgi:hypothetical protein